MSAPEVSVLIISFRTAALLRECLASLEAGLAGVSCEVIVVDNASADGTCELVSREFPRARLVRNETNLGYSRATNQAAAHASGRRLLLLNPDARLLPGAARRLVDFLQTRPRAAAAGARVERPDGRLQPTTYPGLGLGIEVLRLARAHRWLPKDDAGSLFLGSEWDHAEAREVPRISGACLMLRTEAWAEVGPFDEAFFVYGGTHDWCLRARRAGWQVWHCPEAGAVHHGGASTGGAWGDVDRHRRMLEAHDHLLVKHRGRAAAWAHWAISLLSDGVALAGRRPAGERERLRAELFWTASRLLRTSPSGESL